MATIMQLKDVSKAMRLDILRLAYAAGRKGAHIAPSLSMVEIMAVLFVDVMDHERDLFVLSKGHGALCYYTAMHQAGLIGKDQLDTFEENGGEFSGQPSRSDRNRIAFSSGSLGMGLSYGAGRALAKKRSGDGGKVYVLIGDGELNEGSIWEAAMFSAQFGLNNLIAIVDKNNMQSDGCSKDIMRMDVQSIWRSFGWDAKTCDGHDASALRDALISESNRPRVLLAETVKGKGVSFMEHQRGWHHGHMTEAQYVEAMAEVNRS